MISRPTGLDIIEGILQVFNQEINKSGKIQRNNPEIWRCLHACDDEIWAAVFKETLQDERYRNCHWKARELAQHLVKFQPYYGPWTITPYEGMVKRQGRPKEHQCRGKLWNWIFLMRDEYNRINDIYCPNDDSSIGILDPKPKDTLFEFGGTL